MSRPSDGYDFSELPAALSRIGDSLPNVPLVGPATGGAHRIPDLPPLLPAQPRVGVATLHKYPLQTCFIRPSAPQYPTVAHLLSATVSQGLASSIARYVGVAHARHVPLRIDEMNSVSCGTAPGVANAFGSALWALDAVFDMARVGVDGVNIHTYPHAPYELFTFTRSDGKWRGSVAPEYYGLLMFAQAAPAGAQLLRTSGGARDARLVGDARARRHRAHRADQRLHGASAHRRGAHRGRAPRGHARAPPCAGGPRVDRRHHRRPELRHPAVTRPSTGPSAIASVEPVQGTYVVRLPPASVAMLTLSPASSG